MIKLRARSDCSWIHADDRIQLDRGANLAFLSPEMKATLLALPPIEPGDAWPIRWHATQMLAGYAFCCPRCGRVHPWTIAIGCEYRAVNGKCEHRREGTGSCWAWTGSLETGDLTAQPSLHNMEPECGWHGWCRSGHLVDA